MSEISKKLDGSLFAVPDTAISGMLNYVDEVAPIERDDWNRFRSAMKALPSVKISGELTEYGQQFAKHLLEQMEQHAQQSVPDAIHAEYTDGTGVKYAGTLYRVVPKEQERAE